MMIINCPYCGERPHSEFNYGGDASVKPLDFNQIDTDLPVAVAQVYERDNILGVMQEYWHHLYGCRQWLVVKRHTLTHELGEVVALNGSDHLLKKDNKSEGKATS